MSLPHKLVFHIPELALVNDTITPVSIDELLAGLADELQQAGVLSFYTINATGFYKGRSYPERLITLFWKDDPAPMQELFRRWFRENNDQLQQEAFAFELDGVLYTESLFPSEGKRDVCHATEPMI